MSDDTFTPGPWQWDGNGRINAVQFHKPSPHPILDAEKKVYMQGLVALPYACAGDNYHANARLIAAAPELLADLQQAAQILRKYEALHMAKASYDKAEVNAALAARFEATIAKAEGRTV